LIGLIVFVAIALVGWGIAVAKYRTVNFSHSSLEQDALNKADATLKKDGYEEKGIRDILRDATYTGFKTI